MDVVADSRSAETSVTSGSSGSVEANLTGLSQAGSVSGKLNLAREAGATTQVDS
jgi:hypothetical protein